MTINLPSNTERAARNREYSRRYRAKCYVKRNELKVLKEDVLPKVCKATQEAISILEKDQDTSKALETLHQLQGLLCLYLAEPSGSSSHPPLSVTQTQQSDLLTTTSLNPVTAMDSQPENLESNSVPRPPCDTSLSQYSHLIEWLRPHLPIDVATRLVAHQTRPDPSSHTIFTNDL